MKEKGFRYFVEDKMLWEYKKMPIAKRLAWLYAANKLRNGLSKKIRNLHDTFRKAKI